MSKQNYDEQLDAQIGAAGGTSQFDGNAPQAETPQKGLGKLEHAKEILGQMSDLSAEEQASLDAFKDRTKKEREERAQTVNIGDGWIPVDRSEMGIRSLFYPKEWEFFVKAASVSAIKNWTAIDEERADQLNAVLNEICRTSVKIATNGVGTAGWGAINSWDRFWFIMKVREVTFVDGESKVEFTDDCSECDAEITYTLTSKGLFYEFPDDDIVEKYYDGRVWNIDPTEYGVNHNPITLYIPTLGKDQAIIDWATARAREKQKIDENFIRFLPWMMNRASKDMQQLDRQIESLYKEYKGWSLDMFEFMEDVVRNITINPSERLRVTCPNCGQEATSTVRFPNGIKTLFKSTSTVKKFGSR